MNVLVRGNTIEKISKDPIPIDGNSSAKVIAGGGRTLMPGLIDTHWHTMLVRPTPAALLADDVGYLNLVAGAEATDTLMRGFTTVRDMGGPSFGLKRAIDEGIVAGPRIYPSGAIITVTSGHGDFRQPYEAAARPRRPAVPRQEQIGAAMIADSPDEVRVRVREQLMLGATQIKLTAGGGVASPHSPLDVSTFTEAELRAAVEAAENWGTYVTVHAYTPASIQRAIAAGVKCIEHGHLMDEADRQADRRARHLAEHSGVSRRDGGCVSARLAGAGQGVRGVRRHGQDHRAGEEIQAQDGVRHRHPVLPEAGAAPGRIAGQVCALVHPRRNARHGDRDQRRTAGACPASAIPTPASSASSRKARSPTSCWSTATRIANIKLIEDPAKNFVVIMKDGKIYKNIL